MRLIGMTKSPYVRRVAISMALMDLRFTIERLWFAIMQCSNFEVPAHCHTMISRGTTHNDVAADDCQCFDHEPGVDYIGG